MFKLLKKKLSRVVSSISKRIVQRKEKPIIREEVRILKKRVRKREKIRTIVKRVVRKVYEKTLSAKDLDPIIEELKLGLVEADVAYEVAEKIGKELKKELIGRKVRKGWEEKVTLNALRGILGKILSVPTLDLKALIKKTKKDRPFIIVFLGFNGVGKSLCLAKLSKWLKGIGYKPLLAAGDTFRAAGIAQLEAYAKGVGVPVIKQTYGSDSCAVIYDCIEAAKARGYGVVLADTAGRAHTDENLMEELRKICRVNKPDLKVLVLDSLAGSDVLRQFEFFDKAVGVDAVVFSKLDINEKGGNILSVCHLAKKPILFLGVGQRYGELEFYDPDKILNRILPR